MKTIYTILIYILLTNVTNAQERYLTKNGSVTFFSSTPIEDIKADNNQVLSIIDASSGKMAISILMKSFMFKKALMQEHFNENYVESDKYPKATFKGEIIKFEGVSDVKSTAQVKGILTIHGVSKETTIDANFVRTNEAIDVVGDFIVNLADFGIKIPAVVAKNIQENIKVNFNLTHKPFKK
ncbi:YceI family protein [uncultured Polaribacter sp.]|uniref:YceI family protein n=1 Tax=uncultured Polaribacter sp. TaxID=174711 RepID=UPI002629927E|nr:YceI family protein [uncultured Polaribacter sp.]